MLPELKIHLFGRSGRFGKAIAALIEQNRTFALTTLPEAADLFIDVTAPAALPKHLHIALELKKPIVIGTTGLADSDFALLKKASIQIPIFYSPNFSLGMAILHQLVEKTAALFHKEAHIDLVEEHHAAKKDAPSGSALSLAKTIGRPTHIHSLRSGQTIGSHTLYFNSPEEKITLSHHAHSRDAFARGCLTAAQFLSQQPPALYSMHDLLA